VVSQRVSSLLKSTRQEESITLEAVSDTTKISLTTLQCIENGDFTGLSSPAYAKGFIRSYARFLGVDPEKAINLYLKEAHPQSRSKPANEDPELSTMQKLIRLTGNERSTYLLLGGIAFIILGALILGQLRALFAPPSLSITSPIEADAEYSGNLTIIEDSFVIEGVTAPQTIVRLNGEALALNPDLTFSSSTIPLGDKGALQDYIYKSVWKRVCDKSAYY
jgi:cytoskeletal protein RodZ